MDSASHSVDSASRMEMAIELDELVEQLGESDEDCHRLDELKNNSASRMSFLQDMYACVSVELQGGNSTGGLKV